MGVEGKTLSQTFIQSITILTLALIGASARAQTGAAVDAARVGDASHFEFKGLPSWKYELKREKGAAGDVVVLRSPRLAPDAAAKLAAHSDTLIESVKVNQVGLDGQSEIAFRLRSKDVDSFDYISEEPSRLIVDFFPKEESSKAEDAPAASPAAVPEKAPAAKSAKLPPKAPVVARAPAASEFIQTPALSDDGAPLALAASSKPSDWADPEFKRFQVRDYELKEERVIASRDNLYIRFPSLQLGTPLLKTLLSSPPIYEIEPVETDECREARLLLTLFQNKRFAVFLKTAKDFLKRYPESHYDELVRYMMADVRYGFWQEDSSLSEEFEAAMTAYQALSDKHPDSPLAPRTQLLLAYSYLDRGDNLTALQAFQRFLRASPKSKSADGVRISIAQALLNLNRFDDATAALNEIERDALNEKDRAEAAYRKGDVAFQRKDFAEAIVQYRRAIKSYPLYEKTFPNAAFNLSEAAFWSKRYQDSADGFRDFLARHSEHPFGGLALARLGELMEIMGAGQKRAVGAWMESGFRYRGTPGAVLSRIRILAGRMPEMKDKELRAALREIDHLGKTVTLNDLSEFMAVVKSDGYFARGEPEKAAAELIPFYQSHPQSQHLPKIKQRIVRALNDQIRRSVASGDFIEGLRMNEVWKESWLKDSDRIDTQHSIGRAYEQAGLLEDADKTYRAALNKRYSIIGTQKEKERAVLEDLPSTDALNLRLAAVAAERRDFAQAEGFLKAITKPETLPEENRIERSQIAADVAEARGQNEAARKSLDELVATWTGKPASVAPIYLRLAKSAVAAKDWKRAARDVAKVLDLQADAGTVPVDTHAGALELKGDVALARGRKPEAIRAYRELIDAYDGKRPLGSVRYKLGQVLFDLGEMKDAEVAWSALKASSDEVWSRLAQEQMQGAKWQDEYRRYVKRIPALAEAQGEGRGDDSAKEEADRSPAQERVP